MTLATATRRVRGIGAALVMTVGSAALAAAALTADAPLVALGVVGAIGAALIIIDVRWGIAALAAFTVFRLPELATEYHGAPSLFIPLLVLIAAGVAVRARRSGEWPTGGVASARLVAAFVIVAGVSLLASPAAPNAVAALRSIVEDGSAAIVVGLLLTSTADLRRLAWAVVACGGFLAALSLLQVVTGNYDLAFGGLARSAVQNIVGSLDEVRISGSVGDPNFYAQWLVMIIPLAVDRFHDESKTSLRATAAAIAVMLTIAVVATFSRGGMLGLGIVAFFLVLQYPPRPRTLAAVALTALVAVPLLPSEYVGRVAALGDVGQVKSGIDPSVRIRTSQLVAGWRMFLDHPVTGVGYEAYPDRYAEYSRDLGIELKAKLRQTHNLYLEFAAEMGIFGVLLLAGAAAAAASGVRRARRRFEAMSDLTGAGISRAIGLALVGYAATSVFLHLDFARFIWLLLGTALALPAVAAAEDRRRDRAVLEGVS